MRRLYNLPQVAIVELAQDTLQYINEMMGFFWVFIGVMLLMAGTLGTAIIFNGITVNVLQRMREIAIMRALGTRASAITAILTIENLAIGSIGIVVGIPAGRYVSRYLMDSMGASVEDMFSFNFAILPRTYWFAAAFALVMVLVSQIPAIWRVTRMSLATATKGWSE